MTITRIFFGYMVLVGAVTGGIMVAAPQVTDFWLKPYFWVLIAVGLFDGVIILSGRRTPDALLPMDARLAGFVIGTVVMVAIPSLTGSPAKFF